MSYFVFGVGGTGAKFMQTLVHLSAAGLLPDPRRELHGILVDPDDANGNVDECNQLARSYGRCTALQTGADGLFRSPVHVRGPWTPLRKQSVDTLNEIFHYTQRQESLPIESDLLELLFSESDRDMPIHQGFRGRPAIGATVLNNAINFKDDKDIWMKLVEQVRGASNFDGGVPVLFAGSVFGGSGAAGVPTLLQLLRKPLTETVPNVRLGLVLVLPYFVFERINADVIQADPYAFPLATSEALKYYAERGFLEKGLSIYAVGEQTPARMPVSAVGAAEQRNEPHFVELIAGMGGLRFFGGASGQDGALAIAARKEERTLTWGDLPYAEGRREVQEKKLQQFIQFAVAYHLNFYPTLHRELNKRDSKQPLLRHYVAQEKLNAYDVQRDLAYVEDYVVRFLLWLLRLSTPRRGGFEPGLVDINVFAHKDGAGEWALRSEFRKDKDFRNLFVNAPGRQQPDLSKIWKQANEGMIQDQTATGTGRLIRALYDACEI